MLLAGEGRPNLFRCQRADIPGSSVLPRPFVSLLVRSDRSEDNG